MRLKSVESDHPFYPAPLEKLFIGQMRKKFFASCHKNSVGDRCDMKIALFQRLLKPGRMHSAIHGPIRRSGCAPAEPYPPDHDGSATQIGSAVTCGLQLESKLI